MIEAARQEKRFRNGGLVEMRSPARLTLYVI